MKTRINGKKTRLYNIYVCIKQRCFNERNSAFPRYGGRGITMCDEWKNNPQQFLKWAEANGYKDSLQIDRKNNTGSYEPRNCRWVEKCIQAQNTRLLMVTNSSGYRGVTFWKRKDKWRARIQFNGNSCFIGYFKTAVEAARAYNEFVITNNTGHPLNVISPPLEKAYPKI